MPKAYLAFGSNMGASAGHIGDALLCLDRVPGIRVTAVSDYYVTKPWGYTDQPDFVNACCEVETSLSPEALLGVCLGVEAGLGRIRTIKNGPRVIDIDVLIYEGEKRNTPELILPHPRMTERPFVMKPLCDITGGTVVEGIDTGGVLKTLQKAGNDAPGAVVETDGKRK